MTGIVKRFTDNLYNKPHIITQERLDGIFDYLSVRNELGITDKDIINESAILKGEYEASDLTVNEGVAFLKLEGTTVHKETGMDAFCGLLSYEKVKRDVDTIVSMGDKVKLVVATVNSPGGEAYRAFETGREIKATLQKAGLKSVAYVDGISASGGYVLASAFDEIIANPDSEVGSIGVRIALKNPKRKEGEPAEVLYITAGENKVPFKSDGSFKEEFIDKLQSGVNETYDNFVNYVADMRGMTRENVIGTKADTFSAKKSKSLGLIDKVMTGREFVEYIEQIKSNSLVSNSLVGIESDELTSKELEGAEVQSDSVTESGDNTCVITEVAQSEQSASIDKIDNSIEETLMTDKSQEVVAEEVVSQETMLSTQLAEMKAQLAEQASLVAELKQEKEAIAAAKAEREAQLQAEIDAQQKAELGEFTKGLSFVGDAEEKAKLADVLFEVRDVEGVEAIVDALTNAKTLQETSAEPVAVESTEVGEPELEDEVKIRKNRIQERLKANAIKSK